MVHPVARHMCTILGWQPLVRISFPRSQKLYSSCSEFELYSALWLTVPEATSDLLFALRVSAFAKPARHGLSVHC